MKEKRSGEIYQFRLEHNQGLGYAQLLDFSDMSNISGWIIYIYDQFDVDQKILPSIETITNKSIFIGPLTHCKYPARRGKYAWKYIGKSNRLITTEYPTMKYLKGNRHKDNNWANLYPWFKETGIGSSCRKTQCSYEDIRHLETGVIDTQPSTVTKVTMKRLIDSGVDLREYYNLNDEINKLCFIEIVNTYYPLEKTIQLLNLISN